MEGDERKPPPPKMSGGAKRVPKPKGMMKGGARRVPKSTGMSGGATRVPLQQREEQETEAEIDMTQAADTYRQEQRGMRITGGIAGNPPVRVLTSRGMQEARAFAADHPLLHRRQNPDDSFEDHAALNIQRQVRADERERLNQGFLGRKAGGIGKSSE